MTVRNKLSLFCSIVFGVIFIIIALLVYGLFYKNTKNSIYQGLEKTAYITALFHLEEDELNAKDFDKIKLQFEELVPNTSYQLYNSENRLSYGSQSIDIPSHILDEVRRLDKKRFAVGEYLCFGMFYEDNQGDFVIVTKEKKQLLYSPMRQLLSILGLSFLVGLVAIVLLSKWVSRVAYHPFSRVIDQVKAISTQGEQMQIVSPNTNDELQSLIDTFNDLLAKISETFVIQKNFVNYVSHEFKTPLAAIQGNVEVFSMKNRSAQEYEQLSKTLLEQIGEMQGILDTLLVVSDLSQSADSNHATRIDELIWEIVSKIKDRYAKAQLEINIGINASDTDMLYVDKNRTQLLMALLNLIENSVKYSPNKIVHIGLYLEHTTLCLSIVDEGIGIPSEQLADVSKPFYRAHNAEMMQGSGIGLSIALRILEKNGINYSIGSQQGVGTEIILRFLT